MSEQVPALIPALIFDLDGTLIDSKPGIVGCLREVLDARKISGYGSPDSLDRFIDPPVEQWTAELLPHGSAEDRAALARDYRVCYDRVGWSNNSVYPGVTEMIEQLHGNGFPLYVCTSKHEHFAVRILEKFDIAQYFNAIYGDRIDYASHSKSDLLALILRQYAIDRETVWMVGDRSFDIEAAHLNGIRCLAVAWGYGTPEELAQADAVAATPADVIRIVASQAPAKALVS